MDLRDAIRSRPIQVVVILVTAFILYVNTLPNAFLYDDIAQVLNNQWITDIRYLPEIFFQKTWGFDPTHTRGKLLPSHDAPSLYGRILYIRP